MPRLIKVSESTAARRAVTFYCVDATDGLTPETGEAGGQPQISTNGTTFTDTGIGTMSHMGNGQYYATLTTGAVSVSGAWIATRYKSANTAEAVGDAVLVVNFDPSDFGGYVADATWDESTTSHTTASSFGAVVYEGLGLAMKNCALTALTFDSSSRPLTGRKRVYDTAAHAAADDGVTGLLYTYTWTTTYNSAGYPITHVETLQ